jgi:biopolymer transport protein TolQ
VLLSPIAFGSLYFFGLVFPMHSELSILSLITGASVLVQLVMAGLLLMSILSWTLIIRKWFALREAQGSIKQFETEFWQSSELASLYQKVGKNLVKAGPLARMFESGMREFQKSRQQRPGDSQAMLDGARRAMKANFQREVDELEDGLSFLATVGSVSPYIGLFGTVWGIMNSFRGLANVQQATLAAVAPGIAEALVATAIGLFAAIPAVVAYNRFSHDIDRLANRCETFVDEYLNILQRHAK